VCYAFSSYYFDKVGFWDALKQSLYGTLMIAMLMSLTLPLIFAFLAFGRLIKRAQDKKRDQ